MSDQNEDLKLTTEALVKLRAPFEPHQISQKPQPTARQTEEVKKDYTKGIRCEVCGTWHHPQVVHLSYVGHAALTDRLLDVDPFWSWEPLAINEHGLPLLDEDGGMWIRLTVCGMTRLGYGDAQNKLGPNATKERIGDALRNAGMRFGCALELWHKGILHMDTDPEPQAEEKPSKVRHTISDKAFQQALAAIEAGTYTLAEIEDTYMLTPDQQAQGLAASAKAKKGANGKSE